MPEFNFSQLEFADNIEFVILGIPLDCTSAKPTDSRNAPNKIREVSNQFADYSELEFDLNEALIYDAGDIELTNKKIDLDLDLKEIDKKLNSFKNAKNICFVNLGGDHFITYPVIQNLAKIHKNLGLISFDAHLDLYNKWNESSFSNATVIRRICELPNFDLINLIFVGVRDIDLEELDFAKEKQLKMIKSHEINQLNLISILSEKIENMKNNNIKDLYVSIDIDVLDLPYAPGTGYKIPGGLNYRSVWEGLKIIAENFNIVGFDLVEVAPSLDIGNLTSIHASRLILEFIGMIKNY